MFDIQDPTPDFHADTILDRVFLSRLVERLDEDDRREIEAFLEDSTDYSSEYAVRQITHKLAILAGIEWTCGKCKRRLPASGFGWNQPKCCLQCESVSMLYRRSRIDKWVRAVKTGETWECEDCGPRPAAEFWTSTRSRCAECTSPRLRAKKMEVAANA